MPHPDTAKAGGQIPRPAHDSFEDARPAIPNVGPFPAASVHVASRESTDSYLGRQGSVSAASTLGFRTGHRGRSRPNGYSCEPPRCLRGDRVGPVVRAHADDAGVCLGYVTAVGPTPAGAATTGFGGVGAFGSSSSSG
jgi:hypothetical protein